MGRVTWDQPGERYYEIGVQKGVLYPELGPGVPWNGLVSVAEEPTGGEPTVLYIDGVKFMTPPRSEEFSATIEAFTYPEQMDQGIVNRGLLIGEQPSRPFGLSYQTLVGDDLEGSGYKINLIYNAMATPSSKVYTTTSRDTPPTLFSWKINTTHETIPGYKWTSRLTIDSRRSFRSDLERLENAIYGTSETDPYLPSVAEVNSIFSNNPFGYAEMPYGIGYYGGYNENGES